MLSPAANSLSARISGCQRRIEMLREREVPWLRYSDGVGALRRGLLTTALSEGFVDNAPWIRFFGSRSCPELTSPGANSLSIRSCSS